jgi:hypothetical protein
MGRHSVPVEQDDTDTVIDVIEVPEDAPLGRHEQLRDHQRMYYGPDPHATDVLPKTPAQELTETMADELNDLIAADTPTEDAQHQELIRWRKRFVYVLWALFVLGLVLGGLCLAIALVQYTNGCPAPSRPALPA